MKRYGAIFLFLFLNVVSILPAQQKAANANARYYRIICLVHLTGSGKADDPILPEYVAQGTATAQAALTAATAASPVSPSGNGPAAPSAGSSVTSHAATTQAAPASVSASAPPVPRPGFLAWSMQKSDDGTMAIVHIVAADPNAFAAILADTRPEIRVFQIGKDSPQVIQAAMQQYKKDFNLATFEVPVQ